MMPALHIKMSRRSWWNVGIASLTEDREERSSSMKVRLTLGRSLLIFAMRLSARLLFLPLK
jgi:hypothetical protein